MVGLNYEAGKRLMEVRDRCAGQKNVPHTAVKTHCSAFLQAVEAFADGRQQSAGGW